jgi:hypothetical protein
LPDLCLGTLIGRSGTLGAFFASVYRRVRKCPAFVASTI